jgi:hypothetical protein
MIPANLVLGAAVGRADAKTLACKDGAFHFDAANNPDEPPSASISIVPS